MGAKGKETNIWMSLVPLGFFHFFFVPYLKYSLFLLCKSKFSIYYLHPISVTHRLILLLVPVCDLVQPAAE